MISHFLAKLSRNISKPTNNLVQKSTKLNVHKIVTNNKLEPGDFDIFDMSLYTTLALQYKCPNKNCYKEDCMPKY